MKLKKEFITHTMGDRHIMVAAGGSGFNGMVRSNRTAGEILELLKQETTRDEVVDRMLEKYDAPREVIAADVDKVVAALRGINALED